MQELTLQEAETIALSILKQVMEEKVWYLKPLYISFSFLTTKKKISQISELYLILNRLPQTTSISQRFLPTTTSTPLLRLKLSLPGCEKIAIACYFYQP